MAKLKTDNRQLITISSRDDADRALKTIGELERFIAAAANDAEETIALIREKLVKTTRKKTEQLAETETALEEWATANKAEYFTEPRSVALTHGTIGFRWTPWKIKFLGKLKVETIVEKLRANKMTHLIRVEESVDKEKALNYDNETLAPLGMKKTHVDEFYYDLPKEEVKG